jgi:hypothetical protein
LDACKYPLDALACRFACHGVNLAVEQATPDTDAGKSGRRSRHRGIKRFVVAIPVSPRLDRSSFQRPPDPTA